MKAHRVVTLVAPCFLLVLLQLVAAVANPLVGLFAGAFVGGLAWGAQRVLDSDLKHWWGSALLAFATSAVGIGICFLAARSSNPVILIAPFLSGGVAALWHLLTSEDSRRCDVCNRRLTAKFFDCPRCGKIACEQHCWNFEGCRCRRCEETNVPVLSGERTWWDRHMGPRIRQGRCQLCMASAEKADLRTCQQCGRAYCRSCWDAVNGQCRRCLWIIPGLSPRVRKYLVVDDSQTVRRRAPRTTYRSTRVE
jgi:hypothetical protein